MTSKKLEREKIEILYTLSTEIPEGTKGTSSDNNRRKVRQDLADLSVVRGLELAGDVHYKIRNADKGQKIETASSSAAGIR